MSLATWRPILEGELAERGWTALRDICDALAARHEPAKDIALFWAYVDAANADARASERLTTMLDVFGSEIERGVMGGYQTKQRGFELFGGFAGAGWVAAHIADAGELLEAVDDKLQILLSRSHWDMDFDLINGLVGIGVYFLERGPVGHDALARVVDLLTQVCESDGTVIRWYKGRDLLPPQQQQQESGYYNCGMAHGVAGIIAFLSRISAAVPRLRHDAGRLRDGAVRWLLRQRCEDGSFPRWITRDGRIVSPRNSWCAGDAGITIALVAAERDGLRIDGLPSMLTRWMSLPHSSVEDAGFCHGAAGLAHIANRIFQATGDAVYRRSAVQWLQSVLSYHGSQGRGAAGFTMQVDPLWESEFDLLNGIAGVGLTLLAALTNIAPNWDRMLLCDVQDTTSAIR